MKKKSISLRARIMLAFILLTTLTTLLFFVIIYKGFESLEEYFFKESLQTEMEWLKIALAQDITPTLPPQRQFFNAMTAPEFIQNKSLGYHEIDMPNFDEEWHLWVFEYVDQRYYLLQDGRTFEELEEYAEQLLVLAALISFLSALWVAKMIVNKTIAPLTALTFAIENQIYPLPNQQAADEIGILSRAISRYLQQLQNYLSREQCFVSDVSHELRTPLAVILGSAEVLQRHTTDPSTQQSAQRICRVAHEMNEQLSTLLLLSRAPETLSSPLTSLAPIIEQCIERCQPLLLDKPISIQFNQHEATQIPALPELVISVIHNLLRNACQYTEQGHITLTLTKKQLEIIDTGPGLPTHINLYQPERFSQSDHGEGLGLSIVQRIINHLGWKISISHSPQGCQIIVVFA